MDSNVTVLLTVVMYHFILYKIKILLLNKIRNDISSTQLIENTNGSIANLHAVATQEVMMRSHVLSLRL